MTEMAKEHKNYRTSCPVDWGDFSKFIRQFQILSDKLKMKKKMYIYNSFICISTVLFQFHNKLVDE